MKRVFALFVFFPVAAVCLLASDPSVTYMPASFSVGDHVEMRYELADSGPDQTIVISDKDEFPDLPFVEIIEVRQVRRKNQTLNSCVFIPWAPGETKIPAFSVSGIPFPERMVNVSSVLGDSQKEPRPPRKPVLLKGTVVVLGTIAVLGCALILFAFLWVAWFLPFMRRIAFVRALREPAKVFERSLKRLSRRFDKFEAREFYDILSKSARQFFSATVMDSFGSLTYREISVRSEALFVDIPESEWIADFFMRADLVRFGCGTSETGRMKKDLSLFFAVALREVKS